MGDFSWLSKRKKYYDTWEEAKYFIENSDIKELQKLQNNIAWWKSRIEFIMKNIRIVILIIFFLF